MTDRKAILVAVLIVGLFGFAFHRYALSPKYAAQRTLDGQIAEQDSARVAATAQLAAAQDAKRRFKSNYAGVVRLGKAVPAGADTSTLVYQLQAAAKLTGVKFRSLKVAGGGEPSDAEAAAGATGDATQTPAPAGTIAGPGGFSVLPLELTFSGRFFALDDFLRRMQAFVRVADGKIGVRGRLVVVDTIELAPGDDGFPDIRATVSAKAFLLAPGQTATGTTESGTSAAAPSTAGAAPSAAAPTEATPAPTASAAAVDQ